jgi:phosphodiesterase/alkaline phosphatase D-like protein
MRRTRALLTGLLFLGLGTALLAQSLPDAERSMSSSSDAQVVAGPIPEKVTSSSAVVWWQTTAPEESILVYGTAPNDQPYRVQRPWTTTTHEVSVSKLQPGTTYYLAILQPDGTRSAIGQFTTQPVGYSRDSNVRITNGPLFEQITPDSATIAWSTNLPASFAVHYGTDPQKLDETAKAPWTPTTHRVVLKGLNSDTHYYFTIEPSQQLPEASQTTADSDQSAAPPSQPPAQLYGFHTLARGQQAVNIGPRR